MSLSYRLKTLYTHKTEYYIVLFWPIKRTYWIKTFLNSASMNANPYEEYHIENGTSKMLYHDFSVHDFFLTIHMAPGLTLQSC